MRLRDLFKMKKKPVKLSKKVTLKEKIQNWINAHYGPLLIIGFFVAIALFAAFLMCFFPGTESGLVYNNRTGGLI